jgi:uncharacterized protein (DUF983 family)
MTRILHLASRNPWIRQVVPSTKKLPALNCPACGHQILLEQFPQHLRLRCQRCDVSLAIGIAHDWLRVAISLIGGFTVAYPQGLQSPLLFMMGLIYSSMLIFLVAPFFPLRLNLAPDDYIQTLRIPRR